MPARLVSDDGAHVVIRPLVGVTEAEARNYAKASELPIISCCCPACGDLGLQRQRVKRLIAELEVEHPDIKSSMIRALANVGTRHLLDRRLHPVVEQVGRAIAGGVGRLKPDTTATLIRLPGTKRTGRFHFLCSGVERRRLGSNTMKQTWACLLLGLSTVAPAAAQQRPLVTEDPETIGAGNILIEGGFDAQREVVYPASGLTG